MSLAVAVVDPDDDVDVGRSAASQRRLGTSCIYLVMGGVFGAFLMVLVMSSRGTERDDTAADALTPSPPGYDVANYLASKTTYGAAVAVEDADGVPWGPAPEGTTTTVVGCW